MSPIAANARKRGRWNLVQMSPERAFFPLLVVLGFAGTARGTEFSWVPVDADVAFTLAGSDDAGEPTEILAPAGSVSIVEFELRMNGWSLASGRPNLGAAQAGVDGRGLLGINAVPTNPGVDLTPLNNEPYKLNPGGNGLNDGAYIVTDTCHEFIPPNIFSDGGIACGSIPGTIAWGDCLTEVPEFPVCLPHPDFVFDGNLAVGSVATATPNIVWGGVTNAGECTVDEGRSYYLGTLVFNVPGTAAGTYTIGFDPENSTTFMNDCAGSALLGVTNTPGKVTLQTETGKCCYNTRIDPQCIDSVTEEVCDEHAAPRFFTMDATCSGAADECALDCDGVAVSAGGQRAGDVNADGFIGLGDFQLLRTFCQLSGPGTPMASPSVCDLFDFDCDGDLDVHDFAGFQHVFNPP